MLELERRLHPPSMKLFDAPADQQHIWETRESGLAATAHVPGMPPTHPGWEDAAVPPVKVGAYLRDFRSLLQRYDYSCSLYGHFGDGCIHVRIDFDLSRTDGIRRWRRFIDEASDLVLSYHGSFSGEHGDGQVRGHLLPKMYGPELIEAFRSFKSIWDPDWKMSPRKAIDALPMDANLRIGPDFQPPVLETEFSFKTEGDFVGAASRCVGVGKCRNQTGKVMCPSYRGTLAEKYSTRGRARSLFEILQSDPVSDLWRNDDVHNALDLCLACKGGKSDCPFDVDMAAYKAEFNYHHFLTRLRPRAAYAMGLIHLWSRIASHTPWLVNLATQTPGFRIVAKAMGGIAQKRSLPRFAPRRSSADTNAGPTPCFTAPLSFCGPIRSQQPPASKRTRSSR